VRGGDGDLRGALVGEAVHRVDDRVWTVPVDQCHDRLQILAGGVMLGVLLHVVPGGEQEQFRVAGASTGLQILSRLRDSVQRLAATAQRHRDALVQEGEDLLHRVGVAAAKYGIGVRHRTDD
jgi:hypothetical protein